MSDPKPLSDDSLAFINRYGIEEPTTEKRALALLPHYAPKFLQGVFAQALATQDALTAARVREECAQWHEEHSRPLDGGVTPMSDEELAAEAHKMLSDLYHGNEYEVGRLAYLNNYVTKCEATIATLKADNERLEKENGELWAAEDDQADELSEVRVLTARAEAAEAEVARLRGAGNKLLGWALHIPNAYADSDIKNWRAALTPREADSGHS